ncbi:MAG: type II secretion system protein [Elusimicrobiaceae bacterium]|nr:type II secretion system protein [Elusimicrobiaceae bacterium]
MFLENKRAFTLIELLVVVLIIGILSAIALPQYQRAVRKSRNIELLMHTRQIAESFKRYYMETGGATPTLDALDIQIPYDPTKMEISVNSNSAGYYVTVLSFPADDTRVALRYWIKCQYPEYVGKMTCTGDGAIGAQGCRDLGGTGEHNYKFITRMKAYYL